MSDNQNLQKIKKLDLKPVNGNPLPKTLAMQRIRTAIEEMGYRLVEIDETRPWGAYYRIDSREADRFIREFFPGFSLAEAQLGDNRNEVVPKLLIIAPGEQFSWQYHTRRMERWHFLQPGAYYRGMTDELGNKIPARVGEIVQFKETERHRLAAPDSLHYAVAAEIWQHIDPEHPSNEADVIRVQDDYDR